MIWNKIFSLIALLAIPTVAIISPDTNWYIYLFLTVIFLSQNLDPLKIFMEYLRINWTIKYSKNEGFEFSDEDKNKLKEI